MDKAEFDRFVDEYYSMHHENIKITGEAPEYFAEYKIRDSSEIAKKNNLEVTRILDFGSGIGNSIPWFRKYFPDAVLTCSDVSERSLEFSRQRFPGNEVYSIINDSVLSLDDNSFDLAFTACVFHHINHDEHVHWLKEIRRVVRPGGIFVIFEHNPWNPLTLRAVNTCPFDENAHLISSPQLRRECTEAGWVVKETWFRIFFPHAFSVLRPIEKYLRWLGLGAQYCLINRK